MINKLIGIMAGLISLNMPIVFIYLSYASPMYWGSYVVTNIKIYIFNILSNLN